MTITLTVRKATYDVRRNVIYRSQPIRMDYKCKRFNITKLSAIGIRVRYAGTVLDVVAARKDENTFVPVLKMTIFKSNLVLHSLVLCVYLYSALRLRSRSTT